MPDIKYVRFDKLDDGRDVLVLFPASVTHAKIAELNPSQVISAGFVSAKGECYGKSTSLEVSSAPEDSKFLKSQYPTYY